MNKNKLINDLVIQWIRIADRDLIAAEQGLKANIIISEGVCFHCQQAVEKYLKESTLLKILSRITEPT